MKKNIFLSILLLCADFGTINAQIKVQADGSVILGDNLSGHLKVYPNRVCK